MSPDRVGKLLIVDDSPDSAKVLAQAVDGLGEVFVCTSATRALELARAQRPDVVILDIEMPGMSGFEVARALRDEPATAACSLIFVTGHDPHHFEPASFREGAVDFLAKPININTCRMRVGNHLLLKQRSDALLLARAEMDQLLRGLPARVVCMDLEGGVRYVNGSGPVAFSMLNTIEPGARLADCLDEDFMAQVEPVLLRARGGYPAEGEVQVRVPGEDDRVVRLSAVPAGPGLPEGFVLLLFTDISRLKLAERALVEEKELLRVTLTSIGDAVIAVDTIGRVTFMNPIAEQMTGWTAVQARNQAIEIVMPLTEGESGRQLKNPVYLALSERRTVAMALNCRLNALGGVVYQVEDSAAPIRDAQGEIRGAIIVFHDVSEARAMAIKMSHLANHDPLTDLPNRVLLQDRISLAIRRATQKNSRVGLILFDIDNFKLTNNTAGHVIGDRVIQLLASRLQRVLPGGATLARLGGDEFVVLLPEAESPEDVAGLAMLLSAEARQPFVFEQHEIEVTLSGGISIFPDDCEDQEGLLRNADLAMYRAKEDGRNQTCFYSADFEQRLVQRIRAERELRDALQEGRLEVHYQAMYDASGRHVIGAEALVRLRGRGGELVPPMAFIPLAEETGLIVPIGEHVLRQACMAAGKWCKQWPKFRISVNISAVQFAEPSLLETLQAALGEAGLSPQHLELEITENTLMTNVAAARELMQRIRALGIRLSIDDFGTGYSSLTYLKSFPAQTLKLDQSFVRGHLENKDDLAIVRTIISLGQALGMELVAEGVETDDQASNLAGMGCQTLQGYLFSRPVPEGEFPG